MTEQGWWIIIAIIFAIPGLPILVLGIMPALRKQLNEMSVEFRALLIVGFLIFWTVVVFLTARAIG